MTVERFRTVQDECVREVVRLQEALGLPSVTDGEFRRRGWSAGLIDAVEGFGLREGTLGFRDERGERGAPPSPYARARLRRARGIATDEFRFLKHAVTTGVPKVTLPAPDVMHFFLGPRSVDAGVYPDVEEYYADLVAIYRTEIDDLVALGCTYLQLDDTALPCNCDERVRAEVRARGEDPDALTARYVALVNDVLAACPPGVTRVVHMCRGNLKGAWMAEGGYEPIAEQVFGGLAVDALLPRARHRARGRRRAAPLRARADARRPRPREHEDARPRVGRHAQAPDRRGHALRAARAARALAPVRLQLGARLGPAPHVRRSAAKARAPPRGGGGGVGLDRRGLAAARAGDRHGRPGPCSAGCSPARRARP